MAGGKINLRLPEGWSRRFNAQNDGDDDTLAADNTAHVKIIMAQLNGEPWLPDQLYSLLQQTHKNWSLAVSDDGSIDGSVDIIKCFARSHPEHSVTLKTGPGQGFALNFIGLLQEVDPETPFVAFADQDDKWLPEKLERALDKLSDIAPGEPALYCGRTWVCSRRLRRLHPSELFQQTPSFQNAIVQSIGGGNTMVLNNAALRLVQESLSQVQEVASHDWWAYQIVSGSGGHVVYDAKPMVLYRQHEENVIGAAAGLGAFLHRAALVVSGTFRSWNDVNLRALETSNVSLLEDNKRTVQMFRSARSVSAIGRLRLLSKSGIHFQTRMGNLGFWMAAVMKRI